MLNIIRDKEKHGYQDIYLSNICDNPNLKLIQSTQLNIKNGNIKNEKLDESTLKDTLMKLIKGNGSREEICPLRVTDFSVSSCDRFLQRVTLRSDTFQRFCKFFDINMSSDLVETVRKHDSPPTSSVQFTTIPVRTSTVEKESFYISFPNEENQCYEEIQRPGSLIRIRSPQKMGKSSLMRKIIQYAKQELDYRAIVLNLGSINQEIFNDSKTFMKWLCAKVGRAFNTTVKPEDIWDDGVCANDNSTEYFSYLLADNDRPIVLAIDNFDRVFSYPAIETDLCGLLRSWFEDLPVYQEWENLRQIIVYSREDYVPKNLNQSPLNVGLPIKLNGFTPLQVEELITQHGLNWSQSEIEKFINLAGGRPDLVKLTLADFQKGLLSWENFEQKTITVGGIYSESLKKHLNTLQASEQLKKAMTQIVQSDKAVRLSPHEIYKLDDMGLIALDGDLVKPRCDLYRQYFHKHLGE
jgi:hypothetical protein